MHYNTTNRCHNIQTFTPSHPVDHFSESMNEFSHTLSFWFGYFVFYLVVFNFLPFVCFPIFFTPHLYSVDQHCEVFPVPSVISSVLSPCSIIPPVFQGFGSWFFTLFQVCISPILWSPLCFIFIFVFQVFISYLSPCVSAFGFNFTFKLTLFFVLISDPDLVASDNFMAHRLLFDVQFDGMTPG